MLFLVVTTWLLATTPFCSRLRRRARGGCLPERPRRAADAGMSPPPPTGPPSLHVGPRQSPAQPGSSTWPLGVATSAPSCRDKWPPASAAAVPQPPGTRAAPSMATGPLGVTSIPPSPTVGVIGAWGALHHLPRFPLAAPGAVLAPGSWSGSCQGHKRQLAGGICSAGEGKRYPWCASVPREVSVCLQSWGLCASLQRMCKLVLLMGGLLGERVDLLYRHTVNYLGICAWVRGESPCPAKTWGAPVPLFGG